MGWSGTHSEGIVEEKLFNMTGKVTIPVSDTTETSMLDGGVGSKTIRANSLRVGDIIQIDFAHALSSGTTQQSTVKIKFGDVTLVSNTSNLPNGLVNNSFNGTVRIIITEIGTTSKCRIVGQSTVIQGGLAALVRNYNVLNDITIDTTIDNDIDWTYKFNASNVNNTITSLFLDIKKF